MARPYENGWNQKRTRIDGRNQADPAVQAGMRGIHRGMRGEVIGGYSAEGQALGTKAGKAAWKSPGGGRPNALGGGLARLDAVNSRAATASTKVVAAPVAAPAAPPVVQPAPVAARPVASPAVAASPAPAMAKASWKSPRVNKLTGMPFGVRPGDAAYRADWKESIASKPLGPALPAGGMPKPAASTAKTFAPFKAATAVQAVGAPAPARPSGKWRDFADSASPRAAVPSPVPVPQRLSPFPAPLAVAPKPDARHSNRLASKKIAPSPPMATMTTPEAVESRRNQERLDRFRASEAAHAERVAAAKAAVTVPDWQKGTVIGKGNAAWKRYRANFVR